MTQPKWSGTSRPINANTVSFLDLPGELRNKIYDLVFKYDEAIRIGGFQKYPGVPGYWYPRKVVNGEFSTSSHLHLLETCRTVYREASTRHFQNNVFEISKGSKHHDPVGAFIGQVGAGWLESLGEQAHALRKLIINLDTLCPADCCGGNIGYPENFETLPGEKGWIEIGSLLRVIWDRGLDLEVEFVQPRSQSWQEIRAGSDVLIAHPYAASGNDCTATAMSQILRVLIQDGLDIRKYGRLLAGVQIRRNAIGGMVTWTLSRKYHVDDSRRARKMLDSDDLQRYNDDPDRNLKFPLKDVRTAFMAINGGQQLKIVKQKPSFTTLPEVVRNNICRRVIASQSPVYIDLDTDTRLPFGLLHVNKDIYTKWQKVFIQYSEFHLNMSATSTSSTFSNFDALSRLLAMPFNFADPLQDDYGNLRISRHPGEEEPPMAWHTTISKDKVGPNQKIFFRLNFNLSQPVAPQHLRISILPLIMATASTRGGNGTYITLAYPQGVHGQLVQCYHHLLLNELRSAVTNALRDFLTMRTAGRDGLRPEIWIDGLGRVVEVRAVHFCDLPAERALRLQQGGPPSVKDLRFREAVCGCCYPHTLHSRFPFETSALATLDYLTWLMEREAIRGDI